MSSWQEGKAQGEAIGGFLTLGFRIIWFFTRIIWWLGIFLISSVVVGIAALVKMAGPKPELSAGFGSYTGDGSLWQDKKSGQTYPVLRDHLETCEVQAKMGGLAWQRNAISRLVKRGAIFRYQFSAVSQAAPGSAPKAIASQEFLNEARHNITIDHLDPVQASSDLYGLEDNRREAVAAIDHLDWLLTNRGWERTDQLAGHWYARIYSRPTILWDQPIAIAHAEQAEQA